MAPARAARRRMALAAAALMALHVTLVALFCVNFAALGTAQAAAGPQPTVAERLLASVRRSPWLAIHCGLGAATALPGKWNTDEDSGSETSTAPQCVFCLTGTQALSTADLPPAPTFWLRHLPTSAPLAMAGHAQRSAQAIRGPPHV